MQKTHLRWQQACIKSLLAKTTRSAKVMRVSGPASRGSVWLEVTLLKSQHEQG